jgi:hypothetical protein
MELPLMNLPPMQTELLELDGRLAAGFAVIAALTDRQIICVLFSIHTDVHGGKIGASLCCTASLMLR